MPAVAQRKAAASILIVLGILFQRRLSGEWSRPAAAASFIYSRPARLSPVPTADVLVLSSGKFPCVLL